MAKLVLLLTLGLHVFVGPSNAQGTTPISLSGIQMRGRVILPDGSAAARAQVIVQTTCREGAGYRPLHLIADENGAFSVMSFSTDCADYKFTAGLRSGMWLPTGKHLFAVRPNGTSPTLHLEAGVTPEPVIIKLEGKGGEIDLRVRAKATGSYLRAEVTMTRTGTARKGTGMSQSVIVADSPGAIFLLPPGGYRVEISRYICRDTNIWLAEPKRAEFEVMAGERRQVEITMDIANIKVRASYDNPKALNCAPP